jgi:hypothetical protein
VSREFFTKLAAGCDRSLSHSSMPSSSVENTTSLVLAGEWRHRGAVLEPAAVQAGQHRVGVGLHVPGQILLVQPVYRDEQDVLDAAVMVCSGRSGSCLPSGRPRRRPSDIVVRGGKRRSTSS